MNETLQFAPLILSTGFGLAVGYAAWVALAIVGRSVDVPVAASSFEAERRSIVESGDPIYRNLQPIVLDLAALNRRFFRRESLQKLRESFTTGGEPIPWEPEEFIAVKQIEGFLAGLAVAAVSLIQVNSLIAMFIAVAVAVIYQTVALAGVHDKAKSRLRTIKMRLPFVIDLMALIIEAGATFRDALRTVVRENRGHPLGAELARVDRQIELGRPRAEALRSFQDRFDDHDLSEMVFAISKGEELGTPLAKILRNQADQMRLKRSQWGEKAAAEAQVKMTFPGMLVMLACILVVLAPIILPAIRAFTG
jgi:tight adherence protein C